MQEALQLQTQGPDWDHVTCSDEKREVADYKVLQTKLRACTHWSLPKTVRPPRERQMLVVPWLRQDSPDGTPVPPMQLVERPATGTMEGSGINVGLESRRMQTRANL